MDTAGPGESFMMIKDPHSQTKNSLLQNYLQKLISSVCNM